MWYAKKWNPLKDKGKQTKELHRKTDSLEESLVVLLLSFKGTDVGFKREWEREREINGSMQILLASQTRTDNQEWAQKYIKTQLYFILFIYLPETKWRIIK